MGKFLLGLTAVALSVGITYGVTQNNANKQINNLKNEKTELTIQLENEKSDKQKYYEALQESAKTLEAKQILLDNLSETLISKQNELAQINSECLSVKAQLTEKNAEIEQLNQEIENLNDLIGSGDVNQELLNQLSSVTAERDSLNEELFILTNSYSQLESQYYLLVDDNAVLNMTIEQLQNRITELENALNMNVVSPLSATYFTIADGKITGFSELGLEEYNNGTLVDIVFPTSYSLDVDGNVLDGNDIGVVSIGSSAFKNCVNIESIVLLDGITNIYSEAFMGCDNLKSVKLPNTLKGISGKSFFSCDNLRHIWIPASVESISGKGSNSGAFYGCAKNIYHEFLIFMESDDLSITVSDGWNDISNGFTAELTFGVTYNEYLTLISGLME